jgi:hypothetical protein
MIATVSDLVSQKLRKKGLSTDLYEGRFDGDKLHLTLRETCHLQPEFIPQSLISFLTLVANLSSEEQMRILRLVLDVIGGREVKHIELDGERMIYFPDPRGDFAHDEFLQFINTAEDKKADPKKASKGPPKAKPKTKM